MVLYTTTSIQYAHTVFLSASFRFINCYQYVKMRNVQPSVPPTGYCQNGRHLGQQSRVFVTSAMLDPGLYGV